MVGEIRSSRIGHTDILRNVTAEQELFEMLHLYLHILQIVTSAAHIFDHILQSAGGDLR